MFWQYLQKQPLEMTAHNWKKKKQYISTWSIDKLHATISKLYKASQNEGCLNPPNWRVDAIIVKAPIQGSCVPHFLICWRTGRWIISPLMKQISPNPYAFKIDSESICPAAEFVKASLKQRHRFWCNIKLCCYYKISWAFTWTTVSPGALVDADLASFILCAWTQHPGRKRKLYEAALKDIEDKSIDEAAAQAMYLRAAIYYYEHGQQFETVLQHVPVWTETCQRTLWNRDEQISKSEGARMLKTLQPALPGLRWALKQKKSILSELSVRW